MKRLVTLVSIVVFGSAVAAYQAPAQAPAPTPTAAQLEVVKLKDNLFVITSSTPGDAATFSGGNVSVFITDGGVTLVDTKLAAWGPALLEKVKSITPKPVTTIVNTHTHGDHTGNDDKFGKVEIIAHENTKANMAKMPAFAGDKAQFLPSKTFTTTWTQGKGNDQIELRYFGRGHTNGDAWVVFPALRVVHSGDIFARKGLLFMDGSNGGSGVEVPDTLAKAAEALTGIEAIITGHSTVMTVADLREFAEFNREFVNSIRDAKRAGRTVDEVEAAWTLPEKYKGYDPARTRLRGNIELIFKELK